MEVSPVDRIVEQRDGFWYFVDETEDFCGPFPDQQTAVKMQQYYIWAEVNRTGLSDVEAIEYRQGWEQSRQLRNE